MLRRFSHQSRVAERSEAPRSPGKVITVILKTMKRNGGVVNGLTFNAQLTVKLSVFSRLQRLINRRGREFRGRIAQPHLKSRGRSWHFHKGESFVDKSGAGVGQDRRDVHHPRSNSP
jgi:hypothetical protein